MKPISDEAEGRIVRFAAQDGLMLAARLFGEPGGERLPLLCLPGLSRNSKDFIRLGRHMAFQSETPRQVVALDYRGRGRSDYDPDWRAYNPATEAQDVLAATAAFGIGEAVIVGTSRGGIIAMLLAAIRPALLGGVVLNDIGPVIEGAGLTRIKAYLSAAEPPADWDAARAAIGRVIGAAAAIDDIDADAFAQATYREEDGRLRADYDPNLLKLLQNLDPENPIPALWPQFEGLSRIPVLAIRGALSDILSEATLAEMAARHPGFEHFTVAGQGHAPLLRDMPTIARIDAFARQCDDYFRHRH